MYLDDTAGTDLDPDSEGVLVVFNGGDTEVTEEVPGLTGAGFDLHPVQAAGADEVVRGTRWDEDAGSVTVPARTVAVLVRD